MHLTQFLHSSQRHLLRSVAVFSWYASILRPRARLRAYLNGLSQYLGSAGLAGGSGDRTVVSAGGVGDATSQVTLQVMSAEHLKIAEPIDRAEDARPWITVNVVLARASAWGASAS